jgi:protein SCO1
MSKKALFLILFFTVLVIGFYFTLKNVIPGYGERQFQVLNYVRPFSFANQDGDTISESNVAGKVYVAEYFFTTCDGICPIMNNNMRSVYEAYKNEPNFLILSHTVDPDKDSVARLKYYADSMGVDTKKWWFLTGSKDSLYQAARVSYLLDDPKNNSVNIRNGQVRKKIYDGLKKNELEEMIKDIDVLLKEPVTQSRFANNIFGN